LEFIRRLRGGRLWTGSIFLLVSFHGVVVGRLKRGRISASRLGFRFLWSRVSRWGLRGQQCLILQEESKFSELQLKILPERKLIETTPEYRRNEFYLTKSSHF
jgi:hypothetical protein